METLITNRRSSQRFSVRLPIIIHPDQQPLAILAETQDFSIEGFFCKVSEPFPIGQNLRCLVLLKEITLPGIPVQDVCIELEAQVVRLASDRSLSGFGVGCCTSRYRVLPAAAWEEETAASVPAPSSAP